MGSSFLLVLYADEQEEAKQAATAAFKRIAELNAVLSDYDPESEVNHLSASSGSGKWISISPDLMEMLVQSQRYSQQSKGAFDVTVGPLVRLWRKSVREAKLPNKKRLRKVKKAVGYELVALNTSAGKAKLLHPNMRLDFGGIAKGYAVDEAYRVIMEYQVHTAMVDGGGDLYLGPPPPGHDGWNVKIEGTEEEKVLLTNCGIASSGDTYRFVTIEGKRYSHIINPKSGLGLTQRRQVTVIAPSCTQADALASTFSVAGLQKSQRIGEVYPGVAFQYQYQEKEEWKKFQTLRFTLE